MKKERKKDRKTEGKNAIGRAQRDPKREEIGFKAQNASYLNNNSITTHLHFF